MKIKCNLEASSLYLLFSKRSVNIPSDRIVDVGYDDVRRYSLAERADIEFLEKVPFDTNTWTPNNKKLIFQTPLATGNGFGYAGQEMLVALNKIIDVYTVGNSEEKDMDSSILTVMKKEVGIANCITVCFNVPLYPNKLSPSEITGVMTPWETNRISPKMVDNINSYSFAIVTAKFEIDTLRQSGVTVPIYYVPHGVRSDLFPYKEREEKETFTFGHYCTPQYRKGINLASEAFTAAFPKDQYPNLRFEIKATYPVGAVPLEDWHNGDDRVITTRTIGTCFSHAQLLEKLYSWDCLLYPTRGEGFGLPIIEAMATGLPVITTGWSAMPDYIQHKKTGILTKYRIEPVNNFYAPEDRPLLGDWAEPKFDDVVDKMRWAYSHRNALKKVGKDASEDVAKNWTWDKAANMLVEAINDYLD